MFTGIIEASGQVTALESNGGDWRLQTTSSSLDFSDVKEGDSIAVNGVCLTVIRFTEDSFSADVSNETMRCSSLGVLKTGDRVNLEKAMMPSSRLGGHIVSGHVDGLAVLENITQDGRSQVLHYRVPAELARYIAAKGSVCLDGVSLTVNTVKGCEFTVNIIPHTSEKTTMQSYAAGQQVNLEVDVVSRYLERLLSAGAEQEVNSSVDRESLARAGFISNLD